MPGVFTGENAKYNHIIGAFVVLGMGVFTLIARYTLLESATEGTESDKTMAKMIGMLLGIGLIIFGILYVPFGIYVLNKANQRSSGRQRRDSPPEERRIYREHRSEGPPVNPVCPSVNYPGHPGYRPQGSPRNYGYHPTDRRPSNTPMMEPSAPAPGSGPAAPPPAYDDVVKGGYK